MGENVFKKVIFIDKSFLESDNNAAFLIKRRTYPVDGEESIGYGHSLFCVYGSNSIEL
jgi:hypothetical protein